MTQAYSFIPIAAETMGAINSDGITFLDDLGRRITRQPRESLPISTVVSSYSALQRGSHSRHICPHNP